MRATTYTLNMAYNRMHNITQKKQDMTQTNLQFNSSLNAGYDLSYTYADNWQQIRNVAVGIRIYRINKLAEWEVL
jgi:hypothetical protein